MGYGTSGGNVAGPHAVTSANGWAYQYDEIANLKTATKAGEQTRTVSYSPFNTPTSITQGSKFSTLVYGPNQDRIKHSDSNGRVTKYVGGIYEEVTKGGVTQKIHYVGDFALFISKGINTNATYAHEYLHRDHIGSIVAISKGKIATLADVSWQANGAWGERRFNQWNGPLDNLLIPTSTAKGFTDHEHLDAVGLIHMNGRVYDPELGRFMSADPFVQAPYNSQSYNRYSYVFNNPLSFTDPSGYESCQITEYFRATDDETGKHLGTWSQTREGQSSGGTLCGQDAIDFGRDQVRQNQSWDYMIQNFQISYSPQNIQPTGFSMAIPIEGNSFAGAGCGALGICLRDGVQEDADVAAAQKFLGKHAMTAATIAGMIVGPGKAKAVASVGSKPAAYSVAFETKLKASSYPGVSRGKHNQEGNQKLMQAMESDPQFAGMMQALGINISKTATGLAPRTPPTGWVWHHETGIGVLRLVPKPQHTIGSSFWDALHPGGKGGYSIWGK